MEFKINNKILKINNSIYTNKPNKSIMELEGIEIYTSAKFNKLQKFIWKKLLGITIKDI